MIPKKNHNYYGIFWKDKHYSSLLTKVGLNITYKNPLHHLVTLKTVKYHASLDLQQYTISTQCTESTQAKHRYVQQVHRGTGMYRTMYRSACDTLGKLDSSCI